ncbi:glycerol-3-phosphate 1-O-acyltransferase PlsY [Horticoccus luteus]|uniref:Glycerol-3-phosphate acyltransferase n=1 Tax=Horticoccus luteus TaxID=2862869 RepID=A0A8F9XLC2_9BACT|nr:glycerol-3-phosphate 1-O-acyltransferase PlsY [Horticoccus luteus]QYM80543.1 glycerol-3-phosphate 1-O-acyltransferase PlsY [Horticoccus luteus]
MVASTVLALAVGYVLGALPFGYWVARAHGVNIFEVGSKNPGATNVRRVLGAGPGNVVFALDAFKGAVATIWPVWWALSRGHVSGQIEIVQIAGLIGAMTGHSFSLFTKFRGGKGVATASGGVLMLVPLAALVVTMIWIITFYATRYVSLASLLAAAGLPLATWALGRPTSLVVFAALITVFVVLRHRSNIGRLLRGTENRFVKKPQPTSTP